MASDQPGGPTASYGFVAAGLLLLVLAPASRGVHKKCRAHQQRRAAQAAVALAAAATDTTLKADPEVASATAPDHQKNATQPAASPRLSQASAATLPGSPRKSSVAASSGGASSSTRRTSRGALPAAWDSARRSRTYSELSDSLLTEESPDAAADAPRVSFTAEPMNTYV